MRKGIFIPDKCLDATMANRGFGLDCFCVWEWFLSGWMAEEAKGGCRDQWYHLHGVEQEEATI